MTRAPQAEMCWSDDGGHAYNDYRTQSLGKTGEYIHRARWQRLGKSRNRVYEIVCSDPIPVRWIDAYVNGPDNAAAERISQLASKQA